MTSPPHRHVTHIPFWELQGLGRRSSWRHCKWADVSMIGRFGVGLYSLTLSRRRCIWGTIGQGNEDHSLLKEDRLEYLEERRLKDLVKKHSEFISYPIYLWTEKTTEKEVSDDEDEETKKEEEGDVEDVDEEKEKEGHVSNNAFSLGDIAYPKSPRRGPLRPREETRGHLPNRPRVRNVARVAGDEMEEELKRIVRGEGEEGEGRGEIRCLERKNP
ncbi:hypothetical protein Scep_027473 [Stephania cephalantha]|uniref:Uncharacterized protein n=1 Tax=Stephania cephalantha TaxID=152367 RepID=A0AAP0E877_9MAGN